VIGLVGLLVELTKKRRDVTNLLSCAVLLICPLFIGQRAVLLMEGAAVAIVVVALFGQSARKRLHLHVMPVVLAALSIVGVVVVLEVVPAISGHGTVSVPLSSSIVSTIEAPQKVESAQDRLDKWQVIYGVVRQHPFIGQGLGFEYSYYDPGPNQYVVTDEADNMWLDLLVWTGLIGLVLFVLAIVPGLVNGITTWRHHVDPAVGALALALVAAVVGLLTKGAVESIFEKYREATLLGLSLGMLRSAVTSRPQSWVPTGALDVEATV
jgi:O-antigen ligase